MNTPPLDDLGRPLEYRAWYQYNGHRVDIWCATSAEAAAAAHASGGRWRREWCAGHRIYRTRQDALDALWQHPTRFAYAARCTRGEERKPSGQRRWHWHILENEYAPLLPSSAERQAASRQRDSIERRNERRGKRQAGRGPRRAVEHPNASSA